MLQNSTCLWYSVIISVVSPYSKRFATRIFTHFVKNFQIARNADNMRKYIGCIKYSAYFYKYISTKVPHFLKQGESFRNTRQRVQKLKYKSRNVRLQANSSINAHAWSSENVFDYPSDFPPRFSIKLAPGHPGIQPHEGLITSCSISVITRIRRICN